MKTTQTFELTDSTLRAKFTTDGGMALVELTDLVSGIVWGPTPAFTLDIMSIVLRRTDLIERLRVEIEMGDGCVFITQSVENVVHSASATVKFCIERGEFVARIASERISEMCPELSLLAGVNLLPSLMYVAPGSEGHLVLPYRNGALCYPKLHTRISDRFLIYGEQPNWEIMPMLPCTGVARQRGDTKAALLAIVEQGDCDAECRVDIDGIGGGQTSFSLRYRYTEVDPVDPIERVVRFVPLRGENAGYAGMGRRMHKFVLAKAGRGTLAHRAEQNSDIAYAANSFVLKIIHACKDIGSVNGDGELRVFTTCTDAAKQLAAIKDAGIDRLYVQLTGWNVEGHDGKWPTRFPVEPKIGGETALRELISAGKALGFQMQVHDNYIDLLKRSPEFDPDLCVGSVHGGPLKRGCWAGGINYAGWGLSYPPERLQGQMEKVKSLGVAGVYYIDAIGMPLEISYNEKHGPRRYRRACAEGIQRIIRAGRDVFGSAGVENGYLYCATEADYIGSPFLESPESPSSELVDVPVPLWFMAVKGHAFCILNDTFGGAVDFGNNTSQTISRRMLTMAEMGLLPRNEIVAMQGGWGYLLEPALEAIKLEYDLMIDHLSGVGMASLVDHEILEGSWTLGNHITRSRFSNGIVTVCDYGRSRLEVNGKEYPLPNNFQKRPATKSAWSETSSLELTESHSIALH